MSTTKTRKPRSRHLLDGFPPDTRVVAYGVTWDDYEYLVNQVGEARNCRIAFDGKDIEMMTLGPFHERQKSLVDLFIMIVASELKIRAPTHGLDDLETEEAQACDRVRRVLLLRPRQAGGRRGRGTLG